MILVSDSCFLTSRLQGKFWMLPLGLYGLELPLMKSMLWFMKQQLLLVGHFILHFFIWRRFFLFFVVDIDVSVITLLFSRRISISLKLSFLSKVLLHVGISYFEYYLSVLSTQ